MLDLDFHWSLGEGVGERRDIGADLAAAVDRVDDLPAIRPQHAALVGHAYARDALAHQIHRFARCAAEGAVLAHAAYAADVVVAFVHFGDQAADFLGRILQIRVQGNDAPAAHVLEAGHDRHMLAEVAVEQDDPGDIWPLLELFAQDGGGAVAAAVVDEDDLVRDA